jgi:hypothetical protein
MVTLVTIESHFFPELNRFVLIPAFWANGNQTLCQL